MLLYCRGSWVCAYVSAAFFVLLGNVVYAATINNVWFDLLIPFEDGILYPRLGWTFYLNLACGLVSGVLGVVMLIYSKLDHRVDRSEWFIKAQLRALAHRRWETEPGSDQEPSSPTEAWRERSFVANKLGGVAGATEDADFLSCARPTRDGVPDALKCTPRAQ